MCEALLNATLMGVGLDVVGEGSAEFVTAISYASQATGIRLFCLGRCLESFAGEKNRVDLRTPLGVFNDC